MKINSFLKYLLITLTINLGILHVACTVKPLPPSVVTLQILEPGMLNLSYSNQGNNTIQIIFSILGATPYASLECTYSVRDTSAAPQTVAELFFLTQIEPNGSQTLIVNNVRCNGSTTTMVLTGRCYLTITPYQQSVCVGDNNCVIQFPCS